MSMQRSIAFSLFLCFFPITYWKPILHFTNQSIIRRLREFLEVVNSYENIFFFFLKALPRFVFLPVF